MDSHRRDSGGSDDSNDSNKSIDRPPSFSDGHMSDYTVIRIQLEKKTTELDKKHQALTELITDLNGTIDELESMHKATTVASLRGSYVGAAAGIASITGLCLAPFTFGASLVLTGAGAVAGVAGGTTSAASNIANMAKQKTLRQTIETKIKDFQKRVAPMIELPEEMYQILQGIEHQRKDAIMSALKKMKEDIKNIRELENLRNVFTALAVSTLAVCAVDDAIDVAQMSAQAAKAASFSTQAAKAARVTSQAANAARLSSETAKATSLSAQAAKATSLSAQAGKISQQLTKAARMTAAASGALSAVGLALDVYSIVRDSREIAEIYQPGHERKAEDIKSETLKYIHESRQTVAQFQIILDTVNSTKIEILTIVKKFSVQK